MAAVIMNRRERLVAKLEELFFHFRGSMISNLDACNLHDKGVDSCQFDLIEETNRGSMYFQPMSQERLDTLDKRPRFEELHFENDDVFPSDNNADEVKSAVYAQLCRFDEEVEFEEDLRSAIEFTSWKQVGKCCVMEERLKEIDIASYGGTNAPTTRTTWTLLDMFANKYGLPHRSCMASGVIRDVTRLTRHELMIVTGLMGVRMVQKAYLKHEIFPGSKARIVQAHMCSEELRLQVRYSEFYDFRKLTKEWLDVFVRWFLSEALTEPPLIVELDPSKQPRTSDDEAVSLIPEPSKGQTCTSNGCRVPEQGGTPSKRLSRPMWNTRCNVEEATLEQAMARLPVLLDAQ